MNEEQRRRELGALLQSRRKLLRPEELGLNRGPRRRTPGLQREEVALLSSVSVSWYTWIEQGRKINPSPRILSRIAKTLRLSEEERVYISLLAAGEPGNHRSLAVSCDSLSLASMQSILDGFTRIPAVLYNSRFDVVGANLAARAIHGFNLATAGKWECNMLWRFFMDPDRRQMYPDGLSDRGIWNLIAALRMNWAASSDGKAIEELIDQLRGVSQEFNAMWTRQEVGKLTRVAGQFRLRGVGGTMRVHHSRFVVPDKRGYAIAALVPADAQSSRILNTHLDRAC